MSVVKKQFMKVRQIADQTFQRTDKTEVLSKELEAAEKRLEALKQPCLVLFKKMLACHQGAGQEPLDKRKKRMSEFQLSNSMQEYLDTHPEGNSLMWKVLKDCTALQSSLGETLLEAQITAEKEVLTVLQEFLEVDIPNVGKLRKQLFKLHQDMDTARTRYESSVRHFQQAVGPAVQSAHTKAEGCREELEELTMKAEQARDTYAAELYALVSREPSICQCLVRWYELQTKYHERCLQVLNTSTPNLLKQIDESDQRLIYGCSLEDHLRCTGRKIALVLEVCVCCLLETAVTEEGLFRIAGSASKVKKIKNALDAGVQGMVEYVTDPHSVAGALKSYLRALPEPLMTYEAYDAWIQADRISDRDLRLQELWNVLNGLPKPNYENLRYLVKFLHCLCKSSEHNKMSSQNLSIVMSPNLLWSPASQQSNHIGLNMTAANAHSSIVETLISYCDWFFPEEIVFRETLPPFASPKGLVTPPVIDEGICGLTPFKGIVNSAFEGVNGESEDSLSGCGQSPRVVHRPGKKPAPPVPLALGGPSMDGSVESHPAPKSSPPSKPTHPERQVSRSATLDRPNKPKRAPTRKSHDNLAGILSGEDTQQNNNISNQPPVNKPEPESVHLNIGNNEAGVDFMVKREQGGQLSSVRELSIERANWFLGGNQSVIRKEQGHPPPAVPGLNGHSVFAKAENQPSVDTLPISRKEQDVLQPKIENPINIQQTAVQYIVNNNRSSENSVNVGVGQEMCIQKSAAQSETLNKDASVVNSHSGAKQSPGIQDASVKPDVPSTQVMQARTDAKQQSLETNSQLYANRDPSCEPLYENISSQVKKDTVNAQQISQGKLGLVQQVAHRSQEKREVPDDGPSTDRPEEEISLLPSAADRSQEGHEKESKPQVPCKPVALSGESRSSLENTQVRPGGSLPTPGEERSNRSRTPAGSGDKWQFLTSGQGTDRIPDRPPKGGPVEDSSEVKRPPPSPLTKVKPPRPQPPLPPVKPKVNNEAEDTRL